MPVTLYRHKNADDIFVAMQYCLCPSDETKDETCLQSCAPWTPFQAGRDEQGQRWHYAQAIGAQKSVVSKLENLPAVALFQYGKSPERKSKQGLARIDEVIQWDWFRELGKQDSCGAVVLRFGLFEGANHEAPLEAMLGSMRVLPESFEADWRLWQEAKGWRTTGPLRLSDDSRIQHGGGIERALKAFTANGVFAQ